MKEEQRFLKTSLRSFLFAELLGSFDERRSLGHWRDEAKQSLSIRSLRVGRRRYLTPGPVMTGEIIFVQIAGQAEILVSRQCRGPQHHGLIPDQEPLRRGDVSQRAGKHGPILLNVMDTWDRHDRFAVLRQKLE